MGKDIGGHEHESESSVGGNGGHYPGLRGLQDHASLLLCLLNCLIPALEIVVELFPPPQVVLIQVNLSLQLAGFAVQLHDGLVALEELCLQVRHLLGEPGRAER